MILVRKKKRAATKSNIAAESMNNATSAISGLLEKKVFFVVIMLSYPKVSAQLEIFWLFEKSCDTPLNSHIFHFSK